MIEETWREGVRTIIKSGAERKLHAARRASKDGNGFKLLGAQHFVTEISFFGAAMGLTWYDIDGCHVYWFNLGWLGKH